MNVRLVFTAASWKRVAISGGNNCQTVASSCHRQQEPRSNVSCLSGCCRASVNIGGSQRFNIFFCSLFEVNSQLKNKYECIVFENMVIPYFIMSWISSCLLFLLYLSCVNTRLSHSFARSASCSLVTVYRYFRVWLVEISFVSLRSCRPAASWACVHPSAHQVTCNPWTIFLQNMHSWTNVFGTLDQLAECGHIFKKNPPEKVGLCMKEHTGKVFLLKISSKS